MSTPKVTVNIPLKLASMMSDARFALFVGDYGIDGITGERFDFAHCDMNDGVANPLPPEAIVFALRCAADRIEARASRTSPRAVEETVRPAQADSLHAPGSTPN